MIYLLFADALKQLSEGTEPTKGSENSVPDKRFWVGSCSYNLLDEGGQYGPI